MIKKILIGSSIVVVVAGLMFGVLYYVKQQQPSPVKEKQTVTVLDHSKDYGACSLLETSFVKTTLGDTVKNVQDPKDMGIVANRAAGEGVTDLTSDSQSCVYAFIPGGTVDNGFNAGNALTIERIVYSNDSGPKTLIEQVRANGVAIEVEGIGDAAFYDAVTKTSGPNAIYSFRLEVFVDKTSTRYIIRQPADATSFKEDTAKAALIELAKASK